MGAGWTKCAVLGEYMAKCYQLIVLIITIGDGRDRICNWNVAVH